MANTYTQLHIQAIFAVKYRQGIILNEWKNDLYKYISGIIQNNNHKILAINGISDHVHVFFGMRPSQSLSNLMQDVKAGSSKWINDQKLISHRLNGNLDMGLFHIANPKFLP